MKVIDLNVLVNASDDRAAQHLGARALVETAMEGSETIGLPAAVTVGYIRLTTNPRIMRQPQAVSDSVASVKGWLGRPNVTVPQPTHRHYDLLAEMLAATGVGGNLVSDAHLAALSVEHGAELYSYDNDFSRFPGLTWLHPDEALGNG